LPASTIDWSDCVVRLTDEAIPKIKEMIKSGTFAPGEKLPNEADLARLLGLSRNSLREAVSALSQMGVLETRQGDGTYVTNLTPSVLLAGMSHVSELASGVNILELHKIRRMLEPSATADAATRLTDEDFVRLEECMAGMEAARTTEQFIESDIEFHQVIVDACGNETLASLLKTLHGGTQRAHMWRAVQVQGATERTVRMHHEILDALRARDAERAHATDLLHLIDGELWLRQQSDEDAAS
jgi:GntR family transcriptional repressor for pyruvate dehydrogenase complex